MKGRRHRLGGLFVGLALGVSLTVAFAQTAVVPPAGQATLNQARQARLLTASDTTVLPAATRGVHIGDTSPCDIAVVLFGDSAAVTLASVQPGSDHPYSIIKLMSTNTTCNSVVALY